MFHVKHLHIESVDKIKEIQLKTTIYRLYYYKNYFMNKRLFNIFLKREHILPGANYLQNLILKRLIL